MLVIRLIRRGKKHQPTFQVVVTEKKTAPRSGKFIEKLGFLNPRTKEFSLNKERVQYWISQGAKPSDTVHNLLIREKIIEGNKIPKHKKSKKKEEAKPEEKPAEPAEEKKKPELGVKKEPKTEEQKPEEEKKEEPKEKEEPKSEEKKEEKTIEAKEEQKEKKED